MQIMIPVILVIVTFTMTCVTRTVVNSPSGRQSLNTWNFEMISFWRLKILEVWRFPDGLKEGDKLYIHFCRIWPPDPESICMFVPPWKTTSPLRPLLGEATGAVSSISAMQTQWFGVNEAFQRRAHGVCVKRTMMDDFVLEKHGEGRELLKYFFTLRKFMLKLRLRFFSTFRVKCCWVLTSTVNYSVVVCSKLQMKISIKKDMICTELRWNLFWMVPSGA